MKKAVIPRWNWMGRSACFWMGNCSTPRPPAPGDRAECVELPAGYEVPAAGEVPWLTLPPRLRRQNAYAGL